MKEFFNLNKESDKTYSLTISGDIGDMFDDVFFEGNTLDTSIKKELDSIPDEIENIEVRINSRGGSVTVGYSMYNQLRASGKHITTINLGDCSSIASIVFLAGDVRIMPDSSMALIHLPWHTAQQNKVEARKNLERLENVTTSIRSIYSKYLNIPDEEIDFMMENDTLLIADRALEIGFSTSKTLPTGMSVNDDFENKSSEFFASRVEENKKFLREQQKACVAKFNNFNNEVNMTDKTKDKDVTIDVEALIKEKQLLEGKLEAAEKMKADSEANFTAFKAEHKEVDVDAIRAEAKAEALAEMKAYDGVKAQAVKAGFKAEGDTAEDVMRSTVNEFGMKADSFKDLDAITEMFNYVITNKPSQDADDDYAAMADTDSDKDDVKGDRPTNIWDTLNAKSKKGGK